MLTRTAFSFISYNTDGYLKSKLDELILDNKLAFWCYIEHRPEADETKCHKHLLVVPSGMVDTNVIGKYLEEYDPLHPDLPLKCLGVRHAHFADWYLYALHDVDYLYSKGDERKYHYTRDEFICSDNDFFFELIHTSDFTKWKKQADFREAVRKRVPFGELLQNGVVPIQQIYQFKKAYEVLDRFMHGKLRVDEETGELIDDMPFENIMPFDDGGGSDL